MIGLPNAKINIGLHVIRKREDGFHDLETVFYPVPWKDVLEILPAKEDHGISIEEYGNPLSLHNKENLCMKAYKLLAGQYKLPPVRMALLKNIPSEAGLGGGSADAAFTLSMLNEMFKLGLNSEGLAEEALQLGSDCPFFIYNRPMFGTGRGDVLKPVELNLEGLFILIIKPGFSISTKQAFGRIKPRGTPGALREQISQPIKEWKDLIVNDFEFSLEQEFPEIGKLKLELYERGALYASLSGSGSAVYGIFNSEPDLKGFEGYKAFKSKLGKPV